MTDERSEWIGQLSFSMTILQTRLAIQSSSENVVPFHFSSKERENLIPFFLRSSLDLKMSLVLLPSVVLPGIALGSSQKETHDIITSKKLGM